MIETQHQPRERGDLLVLEAQGETDLAALVRLQAGHGIGDRPQDFLRMLRGDRLDVHAAGARGNEHDTLERTVHETRQVEFIQHHARQLDEQPLHGLSCGAGLMRHQPRAEQPRRGPFQHRATDDFFHPAGLAASAGVDLCLHHPGVAAQFIGRFQRFVHGKHRPARRDRNAVFGQQSLGLVFVAGS